MLQNCVCRTGHSLTESPCGHGGRLPYTGWPNKNGTVDTVDFSGLCSDQQLSIFHLAG